MGPHHQFHPRVPAVVLPPPALAPCPRKGCWPPVYNWRPPLDPGMPGFRAGSCIIPAVFQLLLPGRTVRASLTRSLQARPFFVFIKFSCSRRAPLSLSSCGGVRVSNAKGEMLRRDEVTEESGIEETPEQRATFEDGHLKRKERCCSGIQPGILHIPTAILGIVVFASILCIARFSGLAVKDKQMSCVKNARIPLVPPCTPGWIGYEGKCYFFSEDESNWTASQAFCTSCGSSLASIESEPEKVFLLRYKGNADHWIGLWKDQNQTWKWADGATFRNTVHIGGEGGDCAFLSMDIAIVSRCYIPRNWICSHLDAYRKNRSSAEGP